MIKPSMSKYPARFIFLYLLLSVLGLSLLLSGAATAAEFTAMQEQARLYRDKGRQLQDEGNLEAALSYYQKALVVDPANISVYNDAGIVLEGLGYPERAKEMYLKAIGFAPDYPNSYTNMALLCEEQQDYANAVVYWVKRAMLGGKQDGWAEAARKRLGDLARVHPEAFRDIGAQYKGNLEDVSRNAPAALAELGMLQPQKSLNLSLFDESSAAGAMQERTKSRAQEHLATAKDFFAKRDYVAALKEATVAEYLDSSNEEIRAFVERVRKVLYSK